MRDQIEVKTFFFRDHHEFGKNNGITRSKPFFFIEHQFLQILASRPYFEYPSLAKTSEIILLFFCLFNSRVPESCLFFAAQVLGLYIVS